MAAILAQQLREQNEANRERIPAETLVVMGQTTAEVAASGITESSLGVGAKVPDFELPDTTGTEVSPSSLLAEGPVALAFYRGGWYPYCSTELRTLQAKLPEVAGADPMVEAL